MKLSWFVPCVLLVLYVSSVHSFHRKKEKAAAKKAARQQALQERMQALQTSEVSDDSVKSENLELPQADQSSVPLNMMLDSTLENKEIQNDGRVLADVPYQNAFNVMQGETGERGMPGTPGMPGKSGRDVSKDLPSS